MTSPEMDFDLDIGWDEEVECFFDTCDNPAKWSGFHKCLNPQLITICSRHRNEFEELLEERYFFFFCPQSHKHDTREVRWRKL